MDTSRTTTVKLKITMDDIFDMVRDKVDLQFAEQLKRGRLTKHDLIAPESVRRVCADRPASTVYVQKLELHLDWELSE